MKEQLLRLILPHIQRLKNYDFSFDDPAFGLLILLVLFVLSRRWGLKKAFSYSLIVSVLLVVSSKLAPHFMSVMIGTNITGTEIIKYTTLLIILLVSVYYVMIRND